MNITTRNYIELFFVIISLLLVYFVLQLIANNFVKDLIANKVPPTIAISYSDVDTNILWGNVSLNNTSLKIKSKEASQWSLLK